MEFEELKRVGTLKMNLSVRHIGGYMEGRVKIFLCFKRGRAFPQKNCPSHVKPLCTTFFSE